MPGMAKQQLPSEMKILAGLRLRAARAVLGNQSAKQMAEDLGVSANAYSNYETGGRLVDVALAVRLLELTGIGPDWIYAGSTTGVPFDRAQSLREQLNILQQTPHPKAPPGKRSAQRKPQLPKERAPPRPFPGGNIRKNQVEARCDTVVLLARAPG